MIPLSLRAHFVSLSVDSKEMKVLDVIFDGGRLEVAEWSWDEIAHSGNHREPI